MNVGVVPSNVWHSVHVQHVCTYIMCNVILITNMIVYMVVFGDKPILVVDNTPHCLLNKASHCALSLFPAGTICFICSFPSGQYIHHCPAYSYSCGRWLQGDHCITCILLLHCNYNIIDRECASKYDSFPNPASSFSVLHATHWKPVQEAI